MKIKFIVLLIASILISNGISAQATENWFVNQDDAIAYAKEKDANVLMVFAGSDWCRPCIQLKKDILESEIFKTSSSENLSILYLDFPAKKKNKLSSELTLQNEALAAKFNASGLFPKLVLLDAAFNKIKDVDYKGENTAQFLKMIND